MLLRQGRPGDEDGFTLLELIMVVSIIAILIAVAIPTFTQARGKAQDRSAQVNVRNAYTTAKFHYLEARAYTEVKAVLEGLEPSLTFEPSLSPVATGTVYVKVVTNTVFLSAKSASGKCWYIQQNPAAGTVLFASNAAATCLAANAGTLTYTSKW